MKDIFWLAAADSLNRNIKLFHLDGEFREIKSSSSVVKEDSELCILLSVRANPEKIDPSNYTSEQFVPLKSKQKSNLTSTREEDIPRKEDNFHQEKSEDG